MVPLRSLKRVVNGGLVCLLSAILVACGGMPVSTPTAAPAARPSELPLLNEAIDTVARVADASAWTPFDSVPAPNGDVVYFTANGTSGPAVYKVASSGRAVTALASGAPLVAPWGLSISTDGQTLYVADLGTENATDGNAIFALLASGGTPMRLEKTAGSRPNVPDVISEHGVDMLYYSGFDPSDGQPAILKLDPAQNNAPTVVFKGPPLVWPSGVAVTKRGVVYVVDMAAGGNDLRAVYRIQNGTAKNWPITFAPVARSLEPR
jgi:DNA-binding beta-propeller fold protein YncE